MHPCKAELDQNKSLCHILVLGPWATELGPRQLMQDLQIVPRMLYWTWSFQCVHRAVNQTVTWCQRGLLVSCALEDIQTSARSLLKHQEIADPNAAFSKYNHSILLMSWCQLTNHSPQYCVIWRGGLLQAPVRQAQGWWMMSFSTTLTSMSSWFRSWQECRTSQSILHPPSPQPAFHFVQNVWFQWASNEIFQHIDDNVQCMNVWLYLHRLPQNQKEMLTCRSIQELGFYWQWGVATHTRTHTRTHVHTYTSTRTHNLPLVFREVMAIFMLSAFCSCKLAILCACHAREMSMLPCQILANRPIEDRDELSWISLNQKPVCTFCHGSASPQWSP